jgi:hypothetical protein
VDSDGIPTNYNPSIATGDRGRVDIVWSASRAPDEMTPGATWSVMLAQSIDATDAHPRFTQTRVSGLVYTGQLCPACTESGTALHSIEHQFVGVATDGCGMAHLMWLNDSKPEDPSLTSERLIAARQTAGRGVLARPSSRCH